MSSRMGDRAGEPKRPDPQGAVREVVTDRWKIRLDLSEQVLQIDIPKYNFMSSDEDGLAPTLPHEQGGLVPAAALLWKAKQFDDGLVAAVELAAQKGAGCLGGKQALLQSLVDVLLKGDGAGDLNFRSVVIGAAVLGNRFVIVPDGVRLAVQPALDEFLKDELRSKPLGFYTWSDELRAIFQQDRLLQSELRPDQAKELARLLLDVPGARAAYEAHLRLAARLTNPLDRADLRQWFDGAGPTIQTGDQRWSFLPPSRSQQVHLLEQLYGNSPIPDGFDLMTEFIRRVRSGELRLEPSESSGWYDHQTWSLEPLIRPEATPETTRLRLESRYRQHLERLFRGMLALSRETHVKQVRAAVGGCAFRREVIYLSPEMSVEPLPEVYRRRAVAYRFVRGVLEEAFGPDGLQQTCRLKPGGPGTVSLVDELGWMESLFEGAYRVACEELGISTVTPPSTVRPGGGEALFRQWAVTQDADLGRDGRMLVPVFYDRQRRKTKVWAFLGWDRTLLNFSYAKEPAVLSCEPHPARPENPQATDRLSVLRDKYRKGPVPEEPITLPDVQFRSGNYEAATPVFAELYVERLMDREEFRKHCDRHKTRDAILAHLR